MSRPSSLTDPSPTVISPATLPRLVILISGSGTNLQAFIDKAGSSELNASVAAVVSNRPGVKGLDRAEQAGIATRVIDHKDFDNRESFDAQLVSVIDEFQPDLVILAGFMRILTPVFVEHYAGRLMNIHPSLLPKYPGLHTHQRAIDAGDTEGGATVHFVTTELDGGPAIVQAAVPITTDDTADDLAAKVLQQEHLIYPLAANWFCEGKLKQSDNQVLLNENKLPPSGFIHT